MKPLRLVLNIAALVLAPAAAAGAITFAAIDRIVTRHQRQLDAAIADEAATWRQSQGGHP